MGEWKLQVPVKLDPATVARIDRDVQSFQPFCEGRSAMVRVLISLAYAAIDRGILGSGASISPGARNSRTLAGADTELQS